jgi:uncharacterized membrane protein YbhN (UPF0104 family)
MTEPKRNSSALKYLGILLAAIPIVWIFWRLDFKTMTTIIPQVAWWTCPMLFIAVIASMTLQGVRWWILLHAFIADLPLTRALAYHFISVFYGTALPTGVAQDVIKTVIVAQKKDGPVSWAAFWLSRALGLPSLALLSAIGFIMIGGASLPSGWEYSLIVGYLTIVVIFVFSFSKRFTRPVRRILQKFVPLKIMTPLDSIRDSVYQYRRKKKVIILCFIVTLSAQTILITGSALSIYGITGTFPFWQCLTFIPLIELISISFPFTPNGLGVRESLSALMFAYLKLSNEQLGIYVMFGLFFSIFPRLIGAPLIIHGYFKKRNQARKAID